MSSLPETSKRGEPNRRPCADYPLDQFFPTTESKGGSPSAGEKLALRICATCPLAVRGVCLEEALRFPAYDQHGVAGGTTASQRRSIIRGRRAAQLAEVA
ncbi:hypothetical protein ABH930_006403 [Kitasatospora sp. GAS204A]|uniref:WhiB family transcriptional regulator n=1 Tax=unclassified Kitasatospora TaxID=2633591 RepID=UPI0024761AD1|nr:WhiB family transcriptional regulator [Kitasatospora sp. GAS204B]MDH6122005.1 hypothetical protein [Kitasatospora sp. GAS204B]